jgi:hypothetical protein
MTTKKPQDGMREPDVEYRQDQDIPIPTAEEEAALESWLYRNRDAINARIDQSDREFARGEFFTQEEVMAKIKAQIEQRRLRKD